MKNILIIVFTVLVLGGLGFYAYYSDFFGIFDKNQSNNSTNSNAPLSKDLLYNMQYTADGQTFSVQNGVGTEDGTSTLKVVDQPVFGDLNKDGRSDAALWLLKEEPGNVKEYYATISINDGTQYKSEDSVLIGNNITPESIIIIEDKAVYQYETQNKNTIVDNQTTVQYNPENSQLETVPNINTAPAITESPIITKLTQRDWEWINTTYAGSASSTSVPLTKLTLRLDDNGTFAASTDCSGIGGRYEINNNDIVFSEMPGSGTLLYCGGTEDKDFRRALKEVANFEFNSKGNLLMNLKNDAGVMNFK